MVVTSNNNVGGTSGANGSNGTGSGGSGNVQLDAPAYNPGGAGTGTGGNGNGAGGLYFSQNSSSPDPNKTGAFSPVTGGFQAVDNTPQVEEIYSALLDKTRVGLASNHANASAALAQNAKKIDPTYNEKANSLSAQYEIARRNMAAQNNMNGLNSGAGSQMALAQNANYGNSMADIRTAQANAHTENDAQVAALQRQYEQAVQQAVLDNDYARIVELYKQREKDAQSNADMAKEMAKYGDFSGYEELYGPDIAAGMRNLWISQNPDLAFNLGVISNKVYHQITGKWR